MFEKVCEIIMGGTMGKIIKDTIHANGIDIGIYTQDFEQGQTHLQCHQRSG